jgi:hypothetical protein
MSMKSSVLFASILLLGTAVHAADATPKDDITKAAKALGEKANYSWKTTVVVPEGTQFRPGPTDGKTEKDGHTHVTMSFGDNTTQAVIKGDKAAVTNQEGEWKSAAELEDEQGPGRFLAMMARNLRTPDKQAVEIVDATKELKKEGDVYSGDLTDEGAKTLIRFRRRAGGGDGPTVTGAKGSAKFWLSNGELTKYEFSVTGKMDFNGNEFDVDRKTTVEIKDVGTTKVEVPEAAKKKLT